MTQKATRKRGFLFFSVLIQCIVPDYYGPVGKFGSLPELSSEWYGFKSRRVQGPADSKFLMYSVVKL